MEDLLHDFSQAPVSHQVHLASRFNLLYRFFTQLNNRMHQFFIEKWRRWMKREKQLPLNDSQWRGKKFQFFKLMPKSVKMTFVLKITFWRLKTEKKLWPAIFMKFRSFNNGTIWTMNHRFLPDTIWWKAHHLVISSQKFHPGKSY